MSVKSWKIFTVFFSARGIIQAEKIVTSFRRCFLNKRVQINVVVPDFNQIPFGGILSNSKQISSWSIESHIWGTLDVDPDLYIHIYIYSSIFLSASAHKNILGILISLFWTGPKGSIFQPQETGQVDNVEPLKLETPPLKLETPPLNLETHPIKVGLQFNATKNDLSFFLSKEQFSSPFCTWKNGDTACFIGRCSIMEMGQSTVFQQKCWKKMGACGDEASSVFSVFLKGFQLGVSFSEVKWFRCFLRFKVSWGYVLILEGVISWLPNGSKFCTSKDGNCQENDGQTLITHIHLL